MKGVFTMARTKGARAFVTLLLLTVMVIGMMPQPAAAAATMVNVYRDNVLLEDVGAKLEGTRVLLPNYGALLTILPELEGTNFPINGKDIVLEDWARTAGGTYERNGTRVDIRTFDNPIVYKNGAIVYDADVYIDNWGEFILPRGITSARTIFTTTELQGVSNSTNPVALKFVAEIIGYEFRQEGRRVDLTKTTQTGVVVELDGVVLHDRDVIIDSMGEFILPRGIESARTIFTTTELRGISNSTNPVALKFITARLGYEFRSSGNWVYITRNSTNYSDLLFRQNNLTVAFSYRVDGDKVMVKKEVLEKFFEKELTEIQLPQAVEYDFTAYAEHFGYKVTRYQQYYWFRNDGEKPILVDIEGKIVDFPDQQPVIKNGRTLVPIAPIARALGGDASWDGVKKLATIYVGNITVELFIGQQTYYVNNRPFLLDVAAEIIGDRTMIPLRATGDAIGYVSEWRPSTDINWVYMTKK